MNEVSFMNKREETALLNTIYHNAQMGQNELYHVLHQTEDDNFHRLLEAQITEYQRIMDETQQRLRHIDKKPIRSLFERMGGILARCKTAPGNVPHHVRRLQKHL